MKKRSSQKLTKSKKIYVADEKIYRTQSLADLHQELKNDKIIYEFNLQTISDKKTKNKFGALTASINEIKFDSVMEAKYYVHLLHKEQEGMIKNIRLQVPFGLVLAYKDFDGSRVRLIIYLADFCFEKVDDNSKYIVDVKGTETPEFKIKWKLLGYKYPEYIRQIIQWYKPLKTWLTLKEIRKLKKGR